MAAITNQGRYASLYSIETEQFYSAQKARISTAFLHILPMLSGGTEDYTIAHRELVSSIPEIAAFPDLLKDTIGNFCLRAKAIQTRHS